MTQNQTAVLCLTLAILGLALAHRGHRLTGAVVALCALAFLAGADWS